MCVCVCVCVCARARACDILVENHTSTNISDNFEGTALHVAVGKGNLCLFCYFINRGDNVNIPITG
jgi:hypothetical protein